MKTIIVVAAVLASLAAPRADAAQVFATSYAMPNGGGQASGGTFNYWDKEYTGAGAASTDGAALTGGLGNLTDGVVAPNLWFNTENNAGTGPYVGWFGPGRGQLNPLITFNFAGSTLIDQIRIHMDNSNVGGVFAPAQILIDGVSTAFTAPADGTAGFVDFSGLSLSGGSHTLQFNQDFGGNSWIFLSEIEFYGSSAAVPEPATWAMMLLGFGVVGGAMRRRARTSVSFA